jgi:hypothetical protein
MRFRLFQAEVRFRLFQASVRFNQFAWRVWMWSERLQARAQDAWLFGD